MKLIESWYPGKFAPFRINGSIELRRPEEDHKQIRDAIDRFFATSSWGRWEQDEQRCSPYCRFFRRGKWKKNLLGKIEPAGYVDYGWRSRGDPERVGTHFQNESAKNLPPLEWSSEAAVLLEPRKQITSVHYEAMVWKNHIDSQRFGEAFTELARFLTLSSGFRHKKRVQWYDLLEQFSQRRLIGETDELCKYLSDPT